MKIEEFVEVTSTTIEVEYIPRASGPWIARIKKPYGYTNFKHDSSDCMLRSGTGWGKTPDDAIRDLCRNLSEHKLMVVDDSTSKKENRKEFGVPKLEYQ